MKSKWFQLKHGVWQGEVQRSTQFINVMDYIIQNRKNKIKKMYISYHKLKSFGPCLCRRSHDFDPTKQIQQKF